jgi:HSP20 family protein
MSIIPWYPLKKLNNLRQQMNSLFEEMMHDDHLFDDLFWSSAIALSETETELLLKVELVPKLVNI